MQSTMFNTVLYLVDDNNNILFTNDDSGVGGVNSRIPSPSGFVTLYAAGTYYIVATSARANATGFYSLTLVFGAIGGGTGCTYTLDTTVANNVPAAGGGGTVNVTTQPGCPWTSAANPANPNTFLTVTTGGAMVGSGPMTWTAAANAGAARSGTITIAGQTFTVNQLGANACNIANVANNLFTMPVANTAGNIGTVTVTDTNNCGWTASSSDPSWLTIAPGAGTGGVTPVTATVTANTGPQRTATLTIAGQTFTVTQAAGAGGCATTPITLNTPITGTLATTDCTSVLRGTTNYADRYTFNGTAGQVVTITLTSSFFDTFLYLFDPNNTVVAFDDDGGGGRNSRIQFTLSSTGVFTIEATSFFIGSTGVYTITIV